MTREELLAELVDERFGPLPRPAPRVDVRGPLVLAEPVGAVVADITRARRRRELLEALPEDGEDEREVRAACATTSAP